MAKELGAGQRLPRHPEQAGPVRSGPDSSSWRRTSGASEYGVFANKCWPAFESYFGFVPCYVNSRLAARGIPVACEVDIYGALSEYIATCATELPATLLDINNTVPYDMIEGPKKAVEGLQADRPVHGLPLRQHAARLPDRRRRMQLPAHHAPADGAREGPGHHPRHARGPDQAGGVTIFRLQSTADTVLRSYMAEGEVLDIDPKSFGGIGVIGIKEMGRFYRHVLIEKRFPHHTAVAFAPAGKTLFAAMRMLGVEDIGFNRPAGMLYPTENPF